MTKTDQLFTFELDVGFGEGRLTGQALEDLIFNCLAFCLLNRTRAHFFLTGGEILFDGLRTMNTAKILWGSLLSAALAVAIDRLLLLVERKSEKSA